MNNDDLLARAQSDLRTVYAIWADELFGGLSAFVADLLSDAVDQYGEIEVRYALFAASLNNARSMRYVDAVLKSRAAGMASKWLKNEPGVEQ